MGGPDSDDRKGAVKAERPKRPHSECDARAVKAGPDAWGVVGAPHIPGPGVRIMPGPGHGDPRQTTEG